MKRNPSAAASAALLAGALAATCHPALAQLQQQQPYYTQVLNCVKAKPGKLGEYRQFLSGVVAKAMQARVNDGKLVSWSVLRNIMPAGTEAHCDVRIVSYFEGAPPPPASREDMAQALQAAGIHMTADEFYAKRESLTTLVSSELWRVRERVGMPAKGNYVYLNYMKVREPAEYAEFEHSVWRPMAEQWVKDGAMSSWIFGTKILPGGTETEYSAYSADVFPTWKAAFTLRPTQPVFEKSHPGRNYQQAMTRLEKLRDLARRELLVIDERVARQP